jgi:23S rRNA pseudouridine1911/1915/1917 synthase
MADLDEQVEFSVSPSEADVRVDRLLAQRFERQSRTYFGSLCAQGCVLSEGQPVTKGARLREGTRVSVQFLATEEMDARPQRMALDILFEDEHMLLLNKPAGTVVHPAPGNWEGTLVNGVLYYLNASAPTTSSSPPAASPLAVSLDHEEPASAPVPSSVAAAPAGTAAVTAPGADERGASALTSTVVHRLDKGTTGLILFAKTAEAQRALCALFRLRQVRKSYLAVCVGDPGDAPLEVTHPIGRDRANRLRMTVVPEDEGGRAARSVVHKLASTSQFSLCRVDIYTGRTHQIRVHMRQEGLPIVGDDEYGSKQWNQLALKRHRVRRPLLHAHRLGFVHPFTQQPLEFEAPPPEDMKGLIDHIQEGALGAERMMDEMFELPSAAVSEGGS